MLRRIVFEIDGRAFPATLHDTPTADAIWNALSLDCAYSTWGDEIYFDCGVSLSPEDGQETVALGDVGYWPPSRQGHLPVLRPDADERPRRDPPRRCRLSLRQARGRSEGAEVRTRAAC